MRTGVIFMALLSCNVLAAPGCNINGDVVAWQADYCMAKAETDDFAAPSVQKCLKQEARRTFADACAGKTHYKRELCKVQVSAWQSYSSVNACLRDAGFAGAAVRGEL